MIDSDMLYAIFDNDDSYEDYLDNEIDIEEDEEE